MEPERKTYPKRKIAKIVKKISVEIKVGDRTLRQSETIKDRNEKKARPVTTKQGADLAKLTGNIIELELKRRWRDNEMGKGKERQKRIDDEKAKERDDKKEEGDESKESSRA